MSKAPITTHILNLEQGKPATGIKVTLHCLTTQQPIAQALTDADGRVLNWDKPLTLIAGNYMLHFALAPWCQAQSLNNFYPEVNITFSVTDPQQHYHVPLLLNAYGYSTYRGS